MTPTPGEVRAELFALLDVNLDGVDGVLDHETNIEQSGPCYVTVALDRIAATEQVWAVRIYSQTSDHIESGTHRMDTALAAVDDRLGSAGHVPSDWQIGHDAELDALVARAFVNVPRETF